MTLDLEKFISNSIKTQAKIQHLEVSTKTTKSVPKPVKDIIAAEYGENYILDADYMAFFWGDIGKEEVKKLFNVVDKALGKSANKLTETDFKKLDIAGSSQSDDNQDQQSEDGQPSGDQLDATSADDTSDDSSLDSGTAPDNDAVDGSSIDELDEDDASDGIEKPKKTSYFFLKITLK